MNAQPLDVHALRSAATLSPATTCALQAFVAQARASRATPGAKPLLVSGTPAANAAAAATVAHALGVPLLRIDLSGVVSKYIGETEKNLDRILAANAQSQAVLFFDEADALFGKRTDVKDSHDRYANTETGYLLQRIEARPGVAILATNSAPALDAALLRRFVTLPGDPPP